MIYSYRRVSTTEQHNGPEAQFHAINAWVQSHDPLGLIYGRVVDFFDDGVSGSVPLAERPEGAKLVANLTRGDAIVTLKLDRLFRSVADAALTIDEWNNLGIKLVSLTEGFDCTTPYGKAMAHIMSAMAELERSMIGERTKAALAAKKARGERTGQVPYGYDFRDGKLVENEFEQRVIGSIWLYHNKGVSIRGIASILNAEAVPAKRGGIWWRRMVHEVLSRFDKA